MSSDRTLVRSWRLHRGLTQEELADLVATRQAVISGIERGRNATLSMLERIALALEVPVGFLVPGGAETPPAPPPRKIPQEVSPQAQG